MALTKLNFTKDWTDPTDFPTYEDSEAQVRNDLQFLHNETKAGVNKLIDDLESTTDGASGADQIKATSILGVVGGTVQSILESIVTLVQGKVNEPSQEGTNGQVLATDGNGGRTWTNAPTGIVSWGNIQGTLSNQTDLATALGSKYAKPSGGIPSSDLTSAIQTSLGKADTALQSHQDISGKENTSNKVTSISSASTDTQYPSAKAVYDSITSGNGVFRYKGRITTGSSSTYETLQAYMNDNDYSASERLDVSYPEYNKISAYNRGDYKYKYINFVPKAGLFHANVSVSPSSSGRPYLYYGDTLLPVGDIDFVSDGATQLSIRIGWGSIAYTSSITFNEFHIDGIYQIPQAGHPFWRKHAVGDTYRALISGTYAGKQAAADDFIVCINAGNSQNDDDWMVIPHGSVVKTTTISSSSTNDQYPSALAVYNYVNTVLGGIENGNY